MSMSDSARVGLVIDFIYLGIFAMPWLAVMLMPKGKAR
jgi:hypothetical protein